MNTKIDAVMAELIEDCREAVQIGDDDEAMALLDAIEERALQWAAAVPNVAVLPRSA